MPWAVPAVLLAVEYVALSLLPHRWFTIHLYRGAPVVFGLSLLFFGRSAFRRFGEDGVSYQRAWAAIHVLALSLLVAAERVLLYFPSGSPTTKPIVLVGTWLCLLVATIGTFFAAFTRLPRVLATMRVLGSAWVYAAISTVLVVWLRERLQISWDSSSYLLGRFFQEASFTQARALLKLFYPVVVSDPVTHILGTDRFRVNIAGACSGIEGLALVSTFMLVWFVSARRELRLSRAVLLVPIALGVMWLLNLLRLVVLIAIGTAGHPDIAINGFHSQAGWICFNLVALGFLAVAQRGSWLQQVSVPGSQASGQSISLAPARNAAAIYLTPFLAITAASLISQAVSNGFEWLYPLRVLAAVAALWYFRREYRTLNWRCGLLGPSVGVAIAGLWLVAHYAVSGSSTSSAVSTGLASLPAAERSLWVVLRLFAATVTVPIAEELAFRGFLARRIMSADVEGISFARLSLTAITVSSVAFGLMHGRMWLLGTLTGVAFAAVAKQRGRIGEAVGAHIAANAAIAVVALLSGNYSLWS